MVGVVATGPGHWTVGQGLADLLARAIYYWYVAYFGR